MISPTNDLVGESLITGETIASQMRSDFLRSTLTGNRQFAPLWHILDSLRDVSLKYVPILAESFWGSNLAAWLSAYSWNAARLPAWLRQHLAESGGYSEPPGGTSEFDEHLPQRLRFPKLELSAKSLLDRRIMSRPEFDAVSDAAKARAFTIAGDIGESAIDQVRETLSDLTATGPSLRLFREAVEDKLGAGKLGSAHLETVYRTNLQAAYRDGREALVSNPIVSEVFPYQEYIPIHDARVRPEHRALGDLGLNGTGIYRRDDPFWERFTPPNGFNCRCATVPLTIEQAARRGVLEAQRWLETGIRPANPEHRDEFIPFPPTPGFGQKSGVLAA